MDSQCDLACRRHHDADIYGDTEHNGNDARPPQRIFLDSRFIFDATQAGSEPTGRIPEAPTTWDSRHLVLVFSDDESERGDFGDGRSDSLSLIDELLRQPAGHDEEPGSAANVGMFGMSLNNPRLVRANETFEQTTTLHCAAITARVSSLSPTGAVQPMSLQRRAQFILGHYPCVKTSQSSPISRL
jgi:hypothetical protein